MSAGWRIRRAGPGDAEPWAALRHALWPDADPGELREELPALLQDPRAAAFVAVDADGGRLLGFAEATLRADYVNGTESSPVGFLEAWYVAGDARGRGIGRALVEAVAEWTRARGCTELASDSALDDGAAHRAHRGCGFEETERVVYFRRRLD
ncbi:aminoglycoside 6'-N-acetyltransferase I [Vulcaniibacterium tengchongense]|uniref:Aminoglycoside N(6')-acetyltransferase type 1 n=1 Tax=Vulcaniibacterium tengchongense TaxID=1273429 RepID=A0A3N4VDA5_9GAMM|nr:aminoglycoside 6'-N-acetyltransferase [Vulcaniibacterium tengchongense]RPE80992.1 aminoglycoside 6'-N-acetyltransferase I [Vulcaniibacterium tengchongense]